MSGIGHMVFTNYNFNTTPTYTMNTPASVSEGGSTTFTVTTTNVPDATTLYWVIGYNTAGAADFSAVSGSFTITTNTGSFSVSAVADSTTEGTETYYVYIKTGSTSGPNVYAGGPYSISDTSITPLDTISTNLTTANRIVYANAAQGDLIPVSAAEYASYASGVTGIQAQSGMKDTAYQYYNTISTYVTSGPERVTAWLTTYWVPVQAGYVFAIKVKTGETPGTVCGTGFQIGYGTTTTGAGVALSNTLTRTATVDASGYVYFVVKQPSTNVTAGVYMTALVNGFSWSFVGTSFAPANNAGTTYYYTGSTSSTPITQTLNNSTQYNLPCISWLSTTTRPW